MNPFKLNALIILAILSYFSCQFVSADNVPLIDNLPPILVNSNSDTYIFSGFGETVEFDIATRSGNFIIQDLQAACAITPNEIPFNPRIFIDNTAGAYYYCPNNKSLLVLDQNYAPTGSYIDLSSVPMFDEVRIKTFKSQPGLITMLGLMTVPNLINPNAKNFTQSFFVTINYALMKVAKSSQVQGAHGEPIVGLEAISDGRVLTVGEKLYDCGDKLDTYYIGNWGDSEFSQVIDFYLSSSFVFIPHIQITSDEQYLIYTNDHAIFGYNIPNSRIIQSQDVTLVTSSYILQDGTQVAWEQIPLSISLKDRQLFVYRQGNLTEFSIPSSNVFVEGPSIQVSSGSSNTTSSRFYFFREQQEDKALIQISSPLALFSLNDQEIFHAEEPVEVVAKKDIFRWI